MVITPLRHRLYVLGVPGPTSCARIAFRLKINSRGEFYRPDRSGNLSRDPVADHFSDLLLKLVRNRQKQGRIGARKKIDRNDRSRDKLRHLRNEFGEFSFFFFFDRRSFFLPQLVLPYASRRPRHGRRFRASAERTGKSPDKSSGAGVEIFATSPGVEASLRRYFRHLPAREIRSAVEIYLPADNDLYAQPPRSSFSISSRRKIATICVSIRAHPPARASN